MSEWHTERIFEVLSGERGGFSPRSGGFVEFGHQPAAVAHIGEDRKEGAEVEYPLPQLAVPLRAAQRGSRTTLRFPSRREIFLVDIADPVGPARDEW